MSTTHCDACRRPFRTKGGETLHSYSSKSGRNYCPTSDEIACKRERRRLIKTGALDLAADNQAVIEAMRRKA